MNERIKELWNNVDLQEKGNPPSIVITSERELQEFAELIVRECASICDQQGRVGNDDRKAQARLDRDLIKEHFGAEK